MATRAMTMSAGSAVVVLGRWLSWPDGLAALAGAALCFALRILAMWFNWHLPRAHRGDAREP